MVAEPTEEIPSGAPLACIFFEGAEYTSDDVRTVTPGQPTVFVIEGMEIDAADLELVGSLAGAKTRCMDQPWEVYRSNEVVDAEAVYTFTPEYSIVNPEDGHISEISAVWERWTAVDR